MVPFASHCTKVGAALSCGEVMTSTPAVAVLQPDQFEESDNESVSERVMVRRKCAGERLGALLDA